MATISADTSHGGKKPLDQEIPLIPFIDLLFCCVMFLLATAVWNQLGAVESPLPGGHATVVDPEVTPPVFTLHVGAAGFTVSGTDGTSFDVPRVGVHDDYAGLMTRLAALRELAPADALVLAPEDSVSHERVILTLDTALGAGFTGVSVSPTS